MSFKSMSRSSGGKYYESIFFSIVLTLFNLHERVDEIACDCFLITLRI